VWGPGPWGPWIPVLIFFFIFGGIVLVTYFVYDAACYDYNESESWNDVHGNTNSQNWVGDYPSTESSSSSLYADACESEMTNIIYICVGAFVFLLIIYCLIGMASRDKHPEATAEERVAFAQSQPSAPVEAQAVV